MQVVCDDCQAEFKIKPQTEQVEDGGERHWFTCPVCDREYPTAHITTRGIELREKIQELRSRMRQAHATKGRIPNYLNNQMRLLQAQMENEVTGGQGPIS